MEFINLNGKIVPATQASIRADNHSYRYGDGLFETMKVANGRILLAHLHFERLYNGLGVLKFDVPKFFSQENLEQQIIEVCKKKSCEDFARVRLSVSRGHGGLYDDDEKFQWVIECSPLEKTTSRLNENGLIIDIFPDARKSCDALSNLKSASHLLYVMAARFAKDNRLNDSLVLNAHDRICDSTIANVFWVKDKIIFTPPLSEGCIAGVQRKYLLEAFADLGCNCQERNCEIHDLEDANEMFLTNAIRGIRWVKRFRNKVYVNRVTRELYQHAQLQKQ